MNGGSGVVDTYDELDGYSGHQTTEHNDPDRFNSRSPDRVLVDAWPRGHPGGGKHNA
jgi:hypothetical protein